MRLRVVLGVAALAFCAAPIAAASSFPDLPGMGSADKATAGRAPEITGAGAASGGAKTQDEAPVQTAAKKTATQPDNSPITDLPGGGAIPVLGGKVQAGLASNSAVADNGGLIVLAGLGSFAALAWLFYLRRAGVL